jgi:hypothetical protein
VGKGGVKVILKKKDEEIKRLHKHNQDLVNDVNNVKRILQEFESKNKDEYINRKAKKNMTKIIEEEMHKKVEETLNIDEIKLEMQSSIE